MWFNLALGAFAYASVAGRPAIWRWPIYFVAALLGTMNARADELCHFAGTTDYAGQLDVTTDVSTRAVDGTMTVDVIVRFAGTPMPFVHINYLMQEISTWKSDQLQSVAVN